MKPRACINCGKNIWIEVVDPKTDSRTQLERAFDGYCKDCKVSAERTSKAITRKRKERLAAEELDRELIRKTTGMY